MRINVLDRWLDELKSDKWKFLEKRLRINDQCCATGVLCEIGVELGVVTRAECLKDATKLMYSYAHVSSPQMQHYQSVPLDFRKYIAEEQPPDAINRLTDDVMFANDESAADTYDDAIAVLHKWLNVQPDSKYFGTYAV